MSLFDVKMTALADAIKAKNTSVTGKLSVDEMTAAVDGIVINPPSSGADVSGVTATAADVLNTVKFVDNTGTLKSGTIATITPTLSGGVVTVPAGYNPTEQTFQVGGSGIDTSDATATASQMLDGATAYVKGVKITGNIKTVTATLADNVVTVPAGYIAQTQTLTVAEMAEPSVSANIVTIGKGYNKAQKTVTIPEATITNDGEKATVSVGYVKTPQQFNLGGGGVELPDGITVEPSDVRLDVTYIDANGQKQSGTMNELVATPIIIETAGSYTLDDGYYGDCTIEVYNDNLDEINIRDGVNVFGVDGTFTSDATATSADILDGKTAYVKGKKVTGTLVAGGTGDSTVKFGYWTSDGKFQEVDLSGATPVNSGEAVAVDAVTFDTGKPTPDYGGGDGGGIDFYECTSYTPNFAGGLEYSMTLTGSADPLADGTYIRTKWVDPAPEEYTEEPIAIWKNENGYRIEEYFYSEFNYSLYNSSGDGVYYSNMPYWDRVTDYSQIMWYDQINENDEAYLTFSPWQTSELPPTVESWSGYKMRQDSATFAWLRTEEFASSMAVQFLKPKVGEIYSADTTIRVRKLYDGVVYPIPADGLVFYAPLEGDYKDVISKETGDTSGVENSVFNGIRCISISDGSMSWSTAAVSALTGSQSFSLAIMFAQTEEADWRCLMGISPEGERESGVSIFTRNGSIYIFTNGNDQSTEAVIEESKWYTVVMVLKNGKIQVYCNGSSVGEYSKSVSLTADMVYLGADLGQSSHHNFSGFLANAIVYNRELTAEEVAEIHAALMEDVE